MKTMGKRLFAFALITAMATNMLGGLVGATGPQASKSIDANAGRTYKTGDIVKFGNYWQNDTNGDGIADKNDAKEPIEWRVLSQNGDDLFLMAAEGLDAQPYNTTEADVTWETCTLRAWLNDEFYNDAFSASEKNAIKMTTLENDDNQEYGTEVGNNTNDKVFLLSYSDVTNTSYGFLNSYSIEDGNRQIQMSEYGADKGAYNSFDNYSGYGCWSLRTLGKQSNSVQFVNYKGCVINGHIDDTRLAVCPALHLNLKYINQIPETLILVSPTEKAIRYVQSGETYSIGDKVFFGSYWQKDTNGDGTADQKDAKESIEWRVLSHEGDNLFLMATKALEFQPYNTTETDVTWETCTLREWLNNDFYKDAFRASERNAIKMTTLENEDNRWGTEGGNNTNDKLFLLSYGDVTNSSYGFSSEASDYHDTNRHIKATEYAMNSWKSESMSDVNIGNCCWWLRSPGAVSSVVAFADCGGAVYDLLGGSVNNANTAVCPALHLSLKSVKQIVKTTIKFTKKSVKIKHGKKVTLKVQITGAKKAMFSVDKKGKKVVKLSKKKAKSVVVTGKKKGKAIITAKAAGKKATCKVTVK